MRTPTAPLLLRMTRHLVPLCLAACSMLAQAAPVTLNYSGTVGSYQFGSSLSSAIPLGSAVSLSLSFNDTFSDGSYTFSDDLGPVSGSLSVGGLNYLFDGYAPWSYSQSTNPYQLVTVTPKFTGTGPSAAGGDLFALFLSFTPSLTLAADPYLGFSFTNGSFTSYEYAIFNGQGRVTPNGVPLPGTLLMLATGLIGLALARRASPTSAQVKS